MLINTYLLVILLVPGVGANRFIFVAFVFDFIVAGVENRWLFDTAGLDVDKVCLLLNELQPLFGFKRNGNGDLNNSLTVLDNEPGVNFN